MSDMPRLMDESKSHFVKAVLEASGEDRPAVGASDRALAGLGLGLGAATVAATVPHAAAAGVTTASAGSRLLPLVPTTAKMGGFVLAKWIAVAVAGSAVAVGSVEYSVRSAPHTPGSVASTASPRGVPVVTAPPEPQRVAVTAVPAATSALPRAPEAPVDIRETRPKPVSIAARAEEPPTPVPALPTVVASVVRPPVSTPAPPAPSVSAELEALGAVRAALGRGDAVRAIALVLSFEAENPSSVVAEEAAVLHIDALVLAGRRADAAVLADAFFKRYPSSAYREHVRTKISSP
jgi:hypothetical protein